MATSIDRDRLRAMIDSGVPVFEVLPAKEYAEDHLPGAQSLPLREIDAAHVAKLDPSRPLVVYCWDGA